MKHATNFATNIDADIDIEVFHESLHRCTSNPHFLDLFYDTFLSSSDKVAEKFVNTDFKIQKRALKASLYMTMLAADGDPAALSYLEKIAVRHDRNNLDIPPSMYKLWRDSLLHAVRECDPEYSASVEQMWIRVLESGIEFMTAHY